MTDLRLAVRALRAAPVVTTAAVLSLALGIGANTAIFSLVNGLLLRALPVPEPQQLVTISTDSAIKIGFNAGIGWNYPMWDALRARTSGFEGALAWKVDTLDLALAGEKQPAQALITSGGFFTTIGVRAGAGRMFTADDDKRGGGPDGAVAVISHDFWRRRFQGLPGVIGTTLPIERVPFRIVGVAPRGFSGLEVGRSFDVAIPLGAETLIRGGRASVDSPQALTLFVMLRMKPGQTIAGATAALRAMQPGMHGALRLPAFAEEPFTLVPAAAGVDMPGSARPKYERPLLALFAIVGLVLLVACANIANLLLARAAARRHEVSIRLALGASRWRLARQVLVESLVLAGLGATGGLALALWGTRAIAGQLSVAIDTSLDWRVLAFTVAVTTLAAILFGTGAAARAGRVMPIDALKQQGRGLTTGRARGVSGGLVAVQVALSLVLVTAAGLFVRSFTQLSGVPVGFDKDRVLLARVDLSRAAVDPSSRDAFNQRLLDAVSRVPGVARAARSTSTPVEQPGLPGAVTVPGAPAGTERERVVLTNRVTPGWFATYGTAVRAGRDFDSRDTATSEPVVIVNDAFGRRFFPDRDGVGRTVSQRTVVGVVADQIAQSGFKADGTQRSLRDAPPPVMYIPMTQSDAGPPGRSEALLSIRSEGEPALPVRGIASALGSVHPDLAYSVRPIADAIDAGIAQDRVIALLSGFFGGLAVLLAALGLYGVTAYGVSQQRAEIGVRLALGAPAASVVRLVLARVAALVAVGIVAGAGLSIWAMSFVSTLLYGLGPRDPVSIAAAAATLATIAAIAGGVPAYRATRIDPVATLRDN